MAATPVPNRSPTRPTRRRSPVARERRALPPGHARRARSRRTRRHRRAPARLLVRAYDPRGEHTEDPVAWPYYATEEDLRGLPPFVISVNELDPLRDEGIAFARTLARAGVAVSARVNLGIVHGAEIIFRHYVGAGTEAAVADVAGFARARGN